MLVFAAVLYGSALPLWLSVLVALASIPVAALTQRVIEQPFRVGRFIGVRPRWNLSQALASSLTLVLLCTGATVYARSQVDAMLGDLMPSLDHLQPDVDAWCIDPASVDDPHQCVHGVADSTTSVVLFGDSTAEQWYPAIAQIATERGWRLVTLTRPSCSWANITLYDQQLNRVDTDCATWRDHVFARITKESPALVIVANLAYARLVIDGQDTGTRSVVLAAYRDGVSATLATLHGLRIAIIGSTPVSAIDVPTCISEHPDDRGVCALPLSQVPTEWNDILRDASVAQSASYFDPTPWLCDATDCPAVIDHYIVYRDRVHLTQPFALSLAPELETAFGPAVPGIASSPPASPGQAMGPRTVLADTFSRTFDAGWGQPDVGPTWTGTSEGVSVDGMSGLMSVNTAGAGDFELAALTGTDSTVTARWRLDELPVGAPAELHFWPRVVEGNDYYRFYVSVDPSGEVDASLAVTAGGVTSMIAGPTPIGSGFSAGDWWWVRVEASGTNPTSLRSRIWRDGSEEPSAWTQDVTDATARLQVSGNGVQIGIWNSAGETVLPLGSRFDDITISSSP